HIRLYCHHPEVPLDNHNLAYRAADLMAKNFPKAFAKYGGVDINLEKNIPVAAGLAGGSTDGAAVLVGINLLWELGLTLPELQTLAAQLGSDLPFCIAGGTAIATGRGELLDPLPDVNNLWIVLAKFKSIKVSTPWAYQNYRQQFSHNYLQNPQEIQARTHQVHSGPLVQAILKKDGEKIAKTMQNDLEKVVLAHEEKVSHLRQTLATSGGLGTMMSGSGPTVFTLCSSQIEAEQVKEIAQHTLNDPDLEFWTARLIGSGIQVIPNS
ncbi:MAG: 4-(cytidine 5'-diphospho)-2-C-methyl-D-erythritol kinase, partial [Microcystaceae cyanobacterium]